MKYKKYVLEISLEASMSGLLSWEQGKKCAKGN